MGVPVITRTGSNFLTHVGETIAVNSGMRSWIAENDEDYIRLAVEAANNREQLVSLRASMRRLITENPLGDGEKFAKAFEQAVSGMWEAQFKSAEPD
jgi:predicted O-linked N-acetylglucosamine transferase (SPINDLY family)